MDYRSFVERYTGARPESTTVNPASSNCRRHVTIIAVYELQIRLSCFLSLAFLVLFTWLLTESTARHLKCHGPVVCNRCRSLELDCYRVRPLHIRNASFRFAADQPWVLSTQRRRRHHQQQQQRLAYGSTWRWVDETHDVMANSGVDEIEIAPVNDATADDDGTDNVFESVTPDASPPALTPDISEIDHVPVSLTEPGSRLRAIDDLRLTAILLRYFTEEVASRFDLCDPERHFTQIVPQYARDCPPLRYAILTTAARHLIRLQRHRNAAGLIEWQGHRLRDLTEAVALAYHTACIKDLLALSMDPEQVHNDRLLAAAIILRTDEEMDAPLRENPEDQEVFLRMLNVFIGAQVPREAAAIPHSSPSPSSSGSGLRQASFWVALRQEVFTSFMKQRPLTFPLAHCDAFRSLSPAPDAVWADRLVIFCADVLDYCYGNSKVTAHGSLQRWKALVAFQDQLHACLPRSFDPLYTSDSDPFPEIWHLDPSHVTGTTHSELARLLLLAFDPTRPRLGPGSAAQQRMTMESMRAIVRRLCGTALSNRRSAPVFIEALMGINTCGEYFEDAKEQAALLNILVIMRQEHAFPTQRVEDRLKASWHSLSHQQD